MDDARINFLKQEWTGKRVEIDPNTPTTHRFAGQIGTVVTVNMNGRALVRFEETLDTGWFDLPIECLKVAAEVESELPPAPPTDEAESAEKLPPQKADESHRSPPKPPVRPSTMSILEMARRQGAGGETKSE